jgi:hypothetical protein
MVKNKMRIKRNERTMEGSIKMDENDNGRSKEMKKQWEDQSK